jgi:hypothetical protein
MTVIEMRYMEVVVRQLPSLVKELKELNSFLNSSTVNEINNNLKELKDDIGKRL